MKHFTQNHGDCHHNCNHRQEHPSQENVHSTIPVPLANQFQQHILNFQEDVAIENVNPQAAIQLEQVQKWNILNAFEAEQAYRQKLQQWFAAENNVELQHHQAIAGAEQRRQEIELQQQQQATVQEMATQERRSQKE